MLPVVLGLAPHAKYRLLCKVRPGLIPLTARLTASRCCRPLPGPWLIELWLLTLDYRLSIVLYVTREHLGQSISFQLNPDSGVPAYLQLAQQVKQALRVGILDVGDKLPTVKDVVTEVAINPNTVMKAYWELEHEGLVEGRQGVGTFVTRRPAGPPPGTQVRLARSLERWVRTARAEGLDDEGIESLLRQTLSGSKEAETA